MLALALIHHLRIRDGIPFEHLAEFVCRLGRLLIVEFVMPEDMLAEGMLRSKNFSPEDCGGYEGFVRAFGNVFRLLRTAPVPTMRRLLLFEAAA